MNIQSLEKELKDNLQGEVRFDPIARAVYSVDASIYEIEPLGIVLPKTKAELIVAVQIAAKHQVPVIARGAATGIAGGCIGKGLIIDTSKYLNQILEINYDREYAVCEPGVVQDQLNAALSQKGYRLGPDTSTGNRATLGGMLANNAAGARSLRYGKMSDHVEAVEVVLANGELVAFQGLESEIVRQKCAENNVEGHIYREVIRIQKEYREEIALHFPKIPRRVSGYNLDELLHPGPLNISKLIVGSEGTLGITTKIRVKISKKPQLTALVLFPFQELKQAFEAAPFFLDFHLLSLEMIDRQILQAGKQSPALQNKLHWLHGDPACVLVAEIEAENESLLKQRASELVQKALLKKICSNPITLTDKPTMNQIWEVRKAGLGLLLSKRDFSRAIAFLEDVTVPPQNLAPFMEEFLGILQQMGKSAGIYGHVGSGCMHIRPYIDLRSSKELHVMQEMMERVSDLLLKYGGALSGEHGDGLARSWLNKKMFGEKLYGAFKALKNAFDPENRMNPGKIVDGSPFLQNLRMDPSHPIIPVPTFLDFSKEGGFELAADLCNGNGLCRKSEGLMCPSFQATRDEYHTTRSRAQTLRSIITGRLPLSELDKPGLLGVLDLCLECKGCKTECPSQVDMAKMKSEVLYQQQKVQGLSLRAHLFGNLGSFYRWTSAVPAFSNWMQQTWIARQLLNFLGVTKERPLPPLSNERFSVWFRSFKQPQNLRKEIVLFNDTYTEFNTPMIGQSAVKVLNHLGYRVLVPKWHCCGRPLISKGMLEQAKVKAEKLLNVLLPYAKQGLPIILLEPSCLSALIDDYQGLHLGTDVEIVKKQCFTIEQLILNSDRNWTDLFKNSPNRSFKIHTHCHQKALLGSSAALEVLKKLPGVELEEIPSGCCGLAGSFGYEKEHYDISMKIGELVLFPAIRSTDKQTIILANGTSCRSQIQHGTHRKATHFVEILAELLNNC